MSHSANVTPEEASRPWYRQPWLWFLVLFPAMSVSYCIVAITLAVTGDNAMVVDDYSKDGLGINQSLARDAKAADMGLAATVHQSGRELSLRLDSRQTPDANHDYLVLQLLHPTLSDQDRVLQLTHEGDGLYRTQIAGELSGRWYLDLSDPGNQWRIKGEGILPSEAGFTLSSDAADRG